MKWNIILSVYIIFLFNISGHSAEKKEVKLVHLIVSPEMIGSNDNILIKPIPSPDGKKIIFTNNNYDKIWIKKINDDEKPELIVSEPGCGLNSMWIDNTNIYYITGVEKENKRYKFTIYSMDIVSKKIDRLTPLSSDRRIPSVINGQIILPYVKNDSNSKLMNPAKLNNLADDFLNSLFFDKFSSVEEVKKNKQYIILNKKKYANITESDVQTLYYIDGLKLYKADMETGRISLIDNRVYSYSVSQDKKFLAYCKNNDVVIYNVSSKSKKIINDASQPSWMNSDALIYIKSEDDGHKITGSDIYKKNIADNSAEINITRTKTEFEYHPFYEQSNNRIYYSSLSDNSIKYIELK
ncbi:hypothetical protein KA977_06760 [Candidatus Dependentiae bacterium]|nr:hypothetical protein [Candidatus Dependentiae bacterium]